jgi:hypothetical protein
MGCCGKCCHDCGSICCCFGWSARFWLAFCATLQFAACMLTYFSPIIWILGPLTGAAMIIVFISIYMRWRRGLVLFVVVTSVLMVLDLIPLLTLDLRNGKGSAKQLAIMQLANPHRALIYGICFAANWFCLGFAIYILCCEGDKSDEEHSHKGGGWFGSHKEGSGGEEKESLVQKIKSKGKEVAAVRPPKSWV